MVAAAARYRATNHLIPLTCFSIAREKIRRSMRTLLLTGEKIQKLF